VILYANRRFAEMLKTPLEKVIGSTFQTWVAPKSQRAFQSLLKKSKDDKRNEQLALAASDETEVLAYVSVSSLRVNEASDLFCLVATDLTEQIKSAVIAASEKMAQELLAASEKARAALLIVVENLKKAERDLSQSLHKYKNIFENVQDLYYETALDGTILELSPSIEILSKGQYRRDDLLGRKMADFYSESTERPALLAMLQERGRVTDHEIPLKNRDASLVFCSLNSTVIFDARGHPDKIIGSMRDITERKRTLARERLAAEVLSCLNSNEPTRDTIKDILSLVKDSTGIEAIAIRLQEGDDYPFYQANGFPDHFVKMEQSLCAHDGTGQIVRGADGKPILECMCGKVICGRIDSKLPFFTVAGSFWSNNTTKLPAPTAEENQPSHTRNHCSGEGYESVALIPLRSGDEIIGLLQLNDRRRSQFSLDMIQFFEGLGASIGIALFRKRSEGCIKVSLREKEVLLREIHHRAKNNLQIVSSLLNLAARHGLNQESEAVFKQAQVRIRAISLVHEKLYRSTDLSSIDMTGYIESLAAFLFQTYFVHFEQVKLQTEYESIMVDIASAIPLGLIIGELLSNSLKYAFPNGRAGVITIGLRRGAGETFQLRLADDGVGIPEEVHFQKPKSFGFEIIHSLIGQLGGAIELDRTKGTAFTITFGQNKPHINLMAIAP
jgi:PAS domain S-box-containing protein